MQNRHELGQRAGPMRAPFNKTAAAYSINPDGSIGGLIIPPFPCRLVTAAEIHGDIGAVLSNWTYLTCSEYLPFPNVQWGIGSAELLADYSYCAAIAVPHTGPPTWLALLNQTVTPYALPLYYRYTLYPFPF